MDANEVDYLRQLFRTPLLFAPRALGPNIHQSERDQE